MKKRTLCLLLSFVLLLSATVMSTVAYLTDTASVVNTFTVGDVDIKLDETVVDEDGQPILDENGQPVREEKGNEYHLIPGMRYLKDPMISIEADSEPAYIRMMMTVHNADDVQAIIDAHGLTDFSDMIDGWDETVWLYEGFAYDETANTITFEFRYFEVVGNDTDAAIALAALFNTLVVPGEATNEELQNLQEGGFKMVLTGHAIQAAGFENADAAWKAFGETVTLSA
ncbi:MAG: hypothetical protein J6L88_06430, partial [Clostridia bacterium]|nr:hypothetical protein [Clostridia bacterium]